jgi:subtilisin family serine protease
MQGEFGITPVVEIRSGWTRALRRACFAGLVGAFTGGLQACREAPGASPPRGPSELRESVSDRHLVPGHYLVIVRDGHGGNAPGLAPAARASALALNARLIAFVESKGGRRRYIYENLFVGFSAEMTPEVAAIIDALPQARVVQNQWMRLSTSQKPAPTGLDRMGQRALPLDSTYTYQLTGRGVHVYVIDSGIYPSSQFKTAMGSRLSSDGFDETGENTPDCLGHGTHVAGIIGGKKYGVAKEVTLHSVRVFGCSESVQTDAVIAAVDWVTVHALRPAIVNMSLSGARYDELDQRVAQSIASGLIYVVAAGNLNDNDVNPNACEASPGLLDEAITVGSAHPGQDAVAKHSKFGKCVDFFAPGVDILSARADDKPYGTEESGTSMAAAHVTGVAALYLEASVGQTGADLTSVGVRTAIDDAASVSPGTPTWSGLKYIDALSPNKLLHWDSSWSYASQEEGDRRAGSATGQRR